MSSIPPPISATAFASLRTRENLAAALKVSSKYLLYVLFGRRDRASYHVFNIPKRRGGMREISVPPKSLLFMQKRLAKGLLELHVPKPAAHGFLKGRSIVTNAARHAGQRIVFNIDLKDFFGTIHLGRIEGALERAPYNFSSEVATLVAQICTDSSGRLPQGAPTSPIISNIICRTLDDNLQRLAKSVGCRYTRYADDLTFSTSRPALPVELAVLEPLTDKILVGEELIKRIEVAGFKINPVKVRLSREDQRQEVTGLASNESPNVHREFVREIDTLMHCWRKYGYDAAYSSFLRHRKLSPHAADASPDRLRRVLKGKLAFLQMVKGKHDPVCRRLQWDLHDLDTKVSEPISLETLPPAPMRGYIGPFRGWQRIIAAYERSVKFVQVLVEGDPNSFASAFVVDADVLVTAGHVAAAGTVSILIDDTRVFPNKIYFKDDKAGLDFAILKFEGKPFASDLPFHFQFRLPEIGEHVAALGYPTIPYRHTTLVMHSGNVEALPVGVRDTRFIQTSFQSGGGLSGGPLIDTRGYVIGIMVENVYLGGTSEEADPLRLPPSRPYGQSIPFEYVERIRSEFRHDETTTIARHTLRVLP